MLTGPSRGVQASGGALLLIVALSACADDTSRVASDSIEVVSSDEKCQVSVDEAPSGTLVFDVMNEGSDVTGFYVLAPGGILIMGGVENIEPGLSGQLVVELRPAEYITSCQPGMAGDGIRASFAVTDSGNDAD